MLMWSIRKPSPAAVQQFLTVHADDGFTYDAVGRAGDFQPPGFDRDVRREIIGHGERDFCVARDIFRRWGQFPAPWTEIHPRNAPIRSGESLAMLARAHGLWWTNACRIVYVIDEPARFGFAYGTLAEHVECGEEQFLLELADDGAVWYDLRSFSRPRLRVVRLFYPLARRLQRRFARETMSQMRAELAAMAPSQSAGATS